MAPTVRVDGRLARKAKDSIEIWFLWLGVGAVARDPVEREEDVGRGAAGLAGVEGLRAVPEAAARGVRARPGVAGRSGVALRAGRALLVPRDRRLAGGAGLRWARVRVDDAQLRPGSAPRCVTWQAVDDAVRATGWPRSPPPCRHRARRRPAGRA